MNVIIITIIIINFYDIDPQMEFQKNNQKKKPTGKIISINDE